jgi:hypothetical protein
VTERIDQDDDGQPDDVFLENVATLHIERMSRDRIWLYITKEDGTCYRCEFYTPRSGRVLWLLEED